MRVQLAAGEPEKFDACLFSSVAIATSSRVAADSAEVFQTVSQAWRSARQLRLTYSAANSDAPESRVVDVHALFMSDGAWYARVYCHLRRDYRSLALHRITNPQLLDEPFTRSEEIAREIQSGHVFDYETVNNVIVRCDNEKAGIIREREWFPGQTIR
jgi:predicted DNA-binding transcriptional regulator YafY